MDKSAGRSSLTTSTGANALRVESWAGEIRVNAIRLVALIAFYGHHLIQTYLIQESNSSEDERYNLGVTIVVIAWALMIALLHVLLSRRMWPPSYKFMVILGDILLIVALGVLAGGPQTPLMALLFVVIASASLRMSLPLVYVATFGAWAGYLMLCAYYAWVKIGFDKYYATPELQVPRTQQIIMLLALGATGLMSGQCVRQARRLVGGPAVTLSESATNTDTTSEGA